VQPFRKHTGRVAALDRPNVDTDQIIPKQFLKRIERTGFGQYLFHDWRRRADGSDDPAFELNRPEAQGATILLARRNFGCGSSREHAPWALADYGFRAILAPSFADIFYNNCLKNGLLPVRLAEPDIDRLFALAAAGPFSLTVDLEACLVTPQGGPSLPFTIEPFRRECLLHGWDEIALSLANEDKIAAYEKAHGIGA
jgi:3-isopropylmalate/(R)-2-methylmalate dehydratase small subunit